MNERILNRRSGGLFAVGEQSSPLRRPRALGHRRRPAWPRRGGGRPSGARAGRASNGLLHGNAPTDQDHELITPGGLALDRFRRRKRSRTARTSEHDSRVPTRDQPREACQARPERSGRQLIVARMVARLAYLLAAAPRAGAPFACLNCLPPSQETSRATARVGCPRPR
jgi:hypothetical protein